MPIEVLEWQTPVNLHATLASRPPTTETIYVSPLEVSFSQNVIYPRFTDGKDVDEALKLVREGSAVRKGGYGGDDSILLEPPFPTIEAVWWCPKHRDGDGRPIVESDGTERRGVEALFTLDNRRLYVLQRAAVARYPQKCRVAVTVITSSVEKAKHQKKFRTRTNGMSITISEWNGVGRDNARDFSVLRVWDWRSAVATVDTASSGKTAAASEAADKGSCGSWEYKDNNGVNRGPFSNSMMRQWWKAEMLPGDLQIRPYDVVATVAQNASRSTGDEAGAVGTKGGPAFKLVSDVFKRAPEPFAVGWSPRVNDDEADWKDCTECGRKRLEGWSARGNWYCKACWKKWENATTSWQDDRGSN